MGSVGIISCCTRLARNKLVLILASGVALTSVATWMLARAENAEFQAQFDRSVVNRTQLLIERMQLDLSTLDSVKEQLNSAEGVAPERFNALADKVLAQRKEITTLAWIPRARVAGFSKDGVSMKNAEAEPATSEAGRDEALLPACLQRATFPIAYSRSRQALGGSEGLDLWTLPGARHDMLRACDSGTAEFSLPNDKGLRLPFLDRDARHGGFLLFCPVFQPGMPIATKEERQGALRGFVMASLLQEEVRAASFVPPCVAAWMELVDFSSPSGHQTVWANRPPVTPETWKSRLGASIRPRLLTRFNFAGHEMAMSMTANNVNLSDNLPLTHYAVLFFGLVVTGLGGLYYSRNSGYQEKVRHAALLAAANKTLQSEVYENEQEKNDLRRWGTQLEELVEQRTAALQRRNDDLLTEIAERCRVEEEMRRSRDEAEAANRAKDEFIAALSHELRTPLTPVLASISEMESDAALSAELRATMGCLRRNIELEAKLIDDLLDTARISRGGIDLKNELLDVHASIITAREICDSSIVAKGLHVSLSLHASQFHVNGDPTRLSQVFWNILQNAVKFTPANGRIDIRTSNVDDRLRIEFADTGVGISPEAMPRIFNAFEQAEKVIDSSYGGMGLGLSIAKALVDLHCGTIRCESAGRGQGATFTVEFTTAAPMPVSEPILSPMFNSGYSHKRILLVDDNPDTLRILAALLRKWGCTVVTADCVKGALEHIKGNPFDILVSDLGLPDGSGLDIMRYVKAHGGFPGIAISGFGTQQDIRSSLEAGFVEHLVKPINFDRLRTVIEHASTCVASEPANAA